jgi:hypothetical protein
VYGGPRILPALLRPVVYHGPMGSAPFQSELRDRSAAMSMWVSALLPVAVAVGLVTLPLGLVDAAFLVVPGVVAALLVAYATSVAAAARPAPRETSPVRLRVLVAFLHVAQPVARAWGRVRGRPLPSREAPDPAWTGRREDWLRVLQGELSSHWCAVRPGLAHDTWDLQVTAGPLLRCRLRTAVRWEWDPVVRRSWSVSGVGLALLALAVVLVVVGSDLAAAVLGALLALTVLEAVALLRLTGHAVARTTAGHARAS